MVAMVTGVFGLLAVLIPHLLRQNKKLNAVHEQVTNSHHSNLRDDIDTIRGEIAHGFGQVHHRLNLLQNDLAWERRERIEGDRVEKT